MRIEEDIKLDYNNVLLRPKRSILTSRKDAELHRDFTFLNGQDYSRIPLIAANMDGVGTFSMADALGRLGLFTCLVKSYSVDEYVEFFYTDEISFAPTEIYKALRKEYTAYSMGITDDDLIKFIKVYEQLGDRIKYVNIDVANGYTKRFTDFIAMFRNKYPDIVIIAGNVCTADATQELLLNGADIIKVGIGPGSVCTTRIQTGVGYPQLSAVIECADAAHGLDGHIIADGGCTSPGDVAKAFAGGADFVMLGGMLAGHDQGGGKVVDGKMQFYGMSSDTANMKHFGGLKEYRSSEGRDVQVAYKGNVEDTIQDILGGLRSCCTYIGAKGLKQISKCATFIRCTDTHNRIYE